jgi:hypothetical protein
MFFVLEGVLPPEIVVVELGASILFPTADGRQGLMPWEEVSWVITSSWLTPDIVSQGNVSDGVPDS